MSTLSHFFDKAAPVAIHPEESGWWASVTLKRLGETAWGLTALALFLIMGPFAVIAVIARWPQWYPARKARRSPRASANGNRFIKRGKLNKGETAMAETRKAAPGWGAAFFNARGKLSNQLTWCGSRCTWWGRSCRCDLSCGNQGR